MLRNLTSPQPVMVRCRGGRRPIPADGPSCRWPSLVRSRSLVTAALHRVAILGLNLGRLGLAQEPKGGDGPHCDKKEPKDGLDPWTEPEIGRGRQRRVGRPAGAAERARLFDHPLPEDPQRRSKVRREARPCGEVSIVSSACSIVVTPSCDWQREALRRDKRSRAQRHGPVPRRAACPTWALGQVQVTDLGYQCIGSMNDIIPWFIPRMRRSVVVAKVLITARPATRSAMYRSRSKTSPHLQADWSRNIYAGVPTLFLAVAEVGIVGRREGPRRTPWPAHQGNKLLMNEPPLSLELRS